MFLDITDFDDILEKLSDSNFKGTLTHTSSLIVFKNEQKGRKFTNLFCKEYLMTISMVAYLRKNFYLTEMVNEKIGFFHTAGLINIWDRMSTKIFKVSHINAADTRKPITLKNFKGVFMIYLIACLTSCIIFTIEITLHFLFKKFTGKNVFLKQIFLVKHRDRHDDLLPQDNSAWTHN